MIVNARRFNAQIVGQIAKTEAGKAGVLQVTFGTL
jgi:hypothetical protein